MPDQKSPDVLEHLPLGVWVAKVPDGELCYANAAFAEIMGMSARDDVKAGGYSGPYGIFDLEGRPYPEDRLPFVRVLQSRAPVTVEDIVIHRRDGRAVNVRALAKPVFDGDEMTHVVVAFTDITAEIAATNEKNVAQEHLRTAIEHAPVVMFTYDKSGVVTMAQGSPMARLRLKPEEIVGRPIFEVYPDNEAIKGNARRVLERGETVLDSVSVDGLHFETWVGPLKNRAGEITGAIGVATDVTDRVAMQAKVAQADRMASLGTLAAGVAHELNNPLAYVLESLGSIDDLLVLLEGDLERAGQGGLAEKRLSRLRQFASHAREGAERMRVVTADLRTFSRVDDARRAVDVRSAVQSSLRLVAKTLEAKARLVTDFGPTPHVLANEARLSQVVVNLAVNAAQAIPPGAAREAQEIRIATRRDGGQAVIEIADTGRGVPASLRARIFDPFFTTKDAEGTGLGLFVTRNIVESLGGSIEVADRAGGGAVFTIRLPEAAAPVVEARPLAATILGRPRVLLIEDDPTLGELMRGALVKECDVSLARNGRDALPLLVEDGPQWDLVLCDLMLHDTTGMALHDEVSRRRPGQQQRLVFMTGGAFTPEARAFVAALPADRLLEKPFDVRAEVRRRLA